MATVFCKLCDEHRNEIEVISPEKNTLELECGHFWNWETGDSFETRLESDLQSARLLHLYK